MAVYGYVPSGLLMSCWCFIVGRARGHQGEPGAYSEKSLRELLGNDVVAVGKESFEDAFKAVSETEKQMGQKGIKYGCGGKIREQQAWGCRRPSQSRHPKTGGFAREWLDS